MAMIPAGSVIRRARAEAGLSQAELADRMGTTQSAVARLESTRSNPRMATFERALAATGNTVTVSLQRNKAPSVDPTLIAANLRHSPADRLRRFEVTYDNIRELAPTYRGQFGP